MASAADGRAVRMGRAEPLQQARRGGRGESGRTGSVRHPRLCGRRTVSWCRGKGEASPAPPSRDRGGIGLPVGGLLPWPWLGHVPRPETALFQAVVTPQRPEARRFGPCRVVPVVASVSPGLALRDRARWPMPGLASFLRAERPVWSNIVATPAELGEGVWACPGPLARRRDATAGSNAVERGADG